MIHFNFGLSNPFASRWDTIYYKDKVLSKHKAGEIQIVKDNTIISFGLRFTVRQDHGGIMIDFGLLGYSIMLSLNDTRHWNEDEGRYYNYDNAGKAT